MFVVARLRFNLHDYTKDLGTSCEFGGGVFSHVLRPHFLCRVLPCTIGYTRTWRKLHAYVRSRSCAPIPRAQSYKLHGGALASLALAVSAMCYVGGVCVACCRALFDKPELGASFVRVCCGVVAFQLAVPSHTKDLCGACNIGGKASICVLRRRF